MLLMILKSVTIILSVIGIYFHDLSLIFADALQYEASSHVLILPVLIAYMMYRKRKVVLAIVQNDDIFATKQKLVDIAAGFLFCLIALLIYFYGSQTFTPLQYHIFTLPIFVTGLILVMFNSKILRELIVPVVFTIFFVPPPSSILNNFGFVLSVGSTGIANALVNVLGINSWITIDNGTPIINLTDSGGQSLSFAVDVACSGVYSLIAFLVFSIFVAYIVRDKTWKKILIFVTGFPIIYAFNILRISIIIIIGYHWGPNLALEVFHQLGGWVFLFVGTIILLIITEKVLKIRLFDKAAATMTNGIDFSWIRQQSNALIGKPLEAARKRLQIFDATKIAGLILVTICIVLIQGPLFVPTQGPAPILVQKNGYQQGNIELFPALENYTLRYFYRDTDFEKVSGQDYSLDYEYNPKNEEVPRINLLLEVADTTSPLHPWESCLVEWRIILGYNPVSVLDLRDITLFENPVIVGRYFAFHQNSRIQLVLYWFETALLNIDDKVERKQVKISLVVFFDDPENLSGMEEELLPVAESIVSYWRTSITWNTVLLVLSKTSLPLTAISVLALVVLLIVNSLQTGNRYKENKFISGKLSSSNKLLIDSVKETQDIMVSTLDNISVTYMKKFGQPVEKNQIIKIIMRLEKMGLIKSQIINNNDEPIQTWITCT